MFAPELVGSVNADAVAGYGAEELLVVAPGVAKRMPCGWNVFESPQGGLCRLTDWAGRPPFPAVAIAPADLTDVRVDEEVRVLWFTKLTDELVDVMTGKKRVEQGPGGSLRLTCAPSERADTPHVVEPKS